MLSSTAEEHHSLLGSGGAPNSFIDHRGFQAGGTRGILPFSVQQPASKAPKHWKQRAWCAAGITGALVVIITATLLLVVGNEASRHYKPPADAPETTRPIHKTKPTGGRITYQVREGVNYSNVFMPQFHISSRPGTWMNDPNGLLDWAGIRHVFYQHNPVGPVWGPMHWGHVASRDLVKWMRLPIALRPSNWWDQDGIFSGSAGIKPDGSGPYLLYTGVLNYSELGYFYQLQAAAVPSDPRDPLLSNWTQLDGNPLSLDIPPAGTHAQFRDPVTPWSMNRSEARRYVPHLLDLLDMKQLVPPTKHGKDSSQMGNLTDDSHRVWFTAVGTLQQCFGSAALYVSEDLRQWQYAGTLFSQLSQNYTQYSQCLEVDDEVPAGTKGFGQGQCDQFGSVCRMWECPDYISVGSGVQAFKYSDQMRNRTPFAADWYVLSDVGLNYTDLNDDSNDIGDGYDAFVARMGGEPFSQRLLDYGSVYASKSFRMQSGQVMWMGWVFEDSQGCTELCGDGSDFILKHQKWQGMQTLPRVMTVDLTTRSLVLFPVEDMQSLRQDPPLYDASHGRIRMATAERSDSGAGVNGSTDGSLDDACNPRGPAGRVTVELVPEQPSPTGPQRRQLEIRASFQLEYLSSQSRDDSQHQELNAPFQAGVVLRTGNSSFTRIYLTGLARWQPGTVNGSNSSHKAVYLPNVYALDVVVDRTCSGGATQAAAANTSNIDAEVSGHSPSHTMGLSTGASWQGGPVDIPSGGTPAFSGDDAQELWGRDPWGNSAIPALPISMTIWVDASVIEVFAMGGHARITSRIYPFADQVAWGLDMFGECSLADITGHVYTYQLGSCWVDSLD